MRKQVKEVKRIKKYLRPENVETELSELTTRMESKGFVLAEKADAVKRYGKSYTRFTFDKAEEKTE